MPPRDTERASLDPLEIAGKHCALAVPTLLAAYVRDLGRCSVLDADQQRRLAEVIRDPSQTDHQREAAKRSLLESNLRFAFALAKQHQGRGVDLAELVADANLGLIRAVEHYDPRFGVPFVRYAAFWIRHAIRDGIARQRHTVSVPSRRLSDIARLNRAMHALRAQLGRAPSPDELAAATGLSLALTTALLRVSAGELSLDERPETGHPQSERLVFSDQQLKGLSSDIADTSCGSAVNSDASCTHDALRAALSGLSGQEREIITLSFGLADRAPASNDEIARILKLSSERVRQIRERALVRLRRGQSGSALYELWAN